jgi:hypothetical protein
MGISNSGVRVNVSQVDTMTLSYAVHRLSGVASPANAAYSAAELTFQLKNAGVKALFTVVSPTTQQRCSE